MITKISVLVNCVEAIIYLLLYNLHTVPLNTPKVLQMIQWQLLTR